MENRTFRRRRWLWYDGHLRAVRPARADRGGRAVRDSAEEAGRAGGVLLLWRRGARAGESEGPVGRVPEDGGVSGQVSEVGEQETYDGGRVAYLCRLHGNGGLPSRQDHRPEAA